ncbi:hypothetical protein FRC09_006014 [Ceratobasidium sp. 395]|nr:hypothetical protein FRC09_006014 [Ceratobasidium sp. 395]
MPNHAASTTNDPGHYSPLTRTSSGSKSTSCQDSSIIEPACRRSSPCPSPRDPDVQVGAVSSQGDNISGQTDIEHAQLARPAREQAIGNRIAFALTIVGATLNTITLASQALSLLAVYPIKAYAAFVELPTRLRGLLQHQPTQPTQNPEQKRLKVRARGRGHGQHPPPSGSSSSPDPSHGWNQGTAAGGYSSTPEGARYHGAQSSDCTNDDWAYASNTTSGGPIQSLHGIPQVNGRRDGFSEQAFTSANVPPVSRSRPPEIAQSSNYASSERGYVTTPLQPVPPILEESNDPVRGYQCDLCGLKLRRPGLLDDHLNTHLGLRRE